MRFPPAAALVLAAVLAAPAAPALDRAAFTPVFRAAGDPVQPACALLNPEACPVAEAAGTAVRRGPESADPYVFAEWRFRLAPPATGADRRFTLCVVHPDTGAGVIQPRLLTDAAFNGTYAGPAKSASFTCVNTGQAREAWFEFVLPETPWPADTALPSLTVTGLPFLAELRVGPPLTDADWADIRAGLPVNVRPMVTLKRPMELTTTAGIAVTDQNAATLPGTLEQLAEYAPLAKALGFTSIETYVLWRTVEPEAEGRFDFTYYDAVVDTLTRHGLKWFPLLVVGSAYSLPDWFAESPENVGFVCLEHGLSNPIQSIWSPHHRRHVERVLGALGAHYDGRGVLEAVRLGPSGNFGESQYPAGGNWGLRGQAMHIHIGWWAGDEHARADFRRWLREKYGDIAALNAAWNGAKHADFDSVTAELPQVMASRRERLDFTAWYTDSMSDWCDWWARETRKHFPNTLLYQSAGGWGFREAGTDYAAQTKSMVPLGGGVRLTNETDSFEQDFYATRMAMSAARLCGARIGSEPASSHTARGVAGRLFNLLSVNGDHFFTYQGNIMNQPPAITAWLDTLPVMDTRRPPLIEVAVYYPETMNQLEDAAFRHLHAWGFNPRAREIRRVVDVDYLDEHLIRDGYLDKYKALVFVWAGVIEEDVQEKVDAWMRAGGAVFYPSFPRGDLETVEGDRATAQRWARGDTGTGAFLRFRGDMEPPSLYADFVREKLLAQESLHPWTRAAVAADRPGHTFLTVQDDGHLLVLNYADKTSRVTLPDGTPVDTPPFRITRTALPGAGE